MESEFEELYQAFVAAGGLDVPRALAEDFERMLRAQTDPANKLYERCKHGLTYLTCSQCYLHFQKG